MSVRARAFGRATIRFSRYLGAAVGASWAGAWLCLLGVLDAPAPAFAIAPVAAGFGCWLVRRRLLGFGDREAVAIEWFGARFTLVRGDGSRTAIEHAEVVCECRWLVVLDVGGAVRRPLVLAPDSLDADAFLAVRRMLRTRRPRPGDMPDPRSPSSSRLTDR